MKRAPEPKPSRRWLANGIFAAVILLAAGALWLAFGRGKPALYASADFGMGVIERIPLDTDYDYYYDLGEYIVHLQVKDGAIAFLDSACPDHVCEQFGWLSEEGQWACCVPAGVYLSIEQSE